jgi:hypothetical protein
MNTNKNLPASFRLVFLTKHRNVANKNSVENLKISLIQITIMNKLDSIFKTYDETKKAVSQL